MCVVSPVVTELKETKMSGGCRRIAVASVFCGPMVSAGKSYRRKPSLNPGRAEPQYPISVNAVLLPLCGKLMVQDK